MEKNMITLEITDLYLAITHRCNMKPACKHCLRGKAENITMTPQLLDSIFSRVSSVSTLTFTGGEPSIVPNAMIEALNAAKRHNTDIYQVYIVTNGKIVSESFLNACRQWHMYCIECSAPMYDDMEPEDAISVVRMGECDEDRVMGVWVSLSMDDFHGTIPKKNILSLMSLPHLTTDKYHKTGDTAWVLNEGRALHKFQNAIDIRKTIMFSPSAKQLDISDFGDGTIGIESLYIAADGAILKHCDYSYRSQKDWNLGYIKTDLPDNEWLDRLLDEQQKGSVKDGTE